MAIVVDNIAHKLSIHVYDGRNPILGRAVPKFDAPYEFFEGTLIETDRYMDTGEIASMRITDISNIVMKGEVEY